MKTKKQARREAKVLYHACVVNGRLDDDRVREAVRRTIEAKPRGHLLVLDYFCRLVRLELERRTARVETAEPLAPEQAAAVEMNLRRRYGEDLDLSFLTEPSLLGGMRIRVGSDVLDGSVRGRISELEEHL
jgi:F-type H+-transporting ATPase subunit delta